MAFNYIDIDPTSLNYDQVVQLEGVEYLFNFFWADRESAWYLSIYDQSLNPLALYVRLVITWPLLRRFTDSRLPPGILFCSDMSQTESDIALPSDLGTRVKLVYLDSSGP